MPRPKKTLSERLQVISTMHCISSVKHIPLSGYAFEKYFEPENFQESKRTGKIYRSDKYDRFINKGVSPIGKSLSRIKEKCPYAYQHYCSPFWRAIEVKERTPEQWRNFYLALDDAVARLVFEFLWSRNPMDGRRTNQENMPLMKLIRIGNDHAIAGLIGLLQQFKQNLIAFDYIEMQLYNVIFNFLSHFFPHDIQLHVYGYLFNQIFSRSREGLRESPWPNDPEAVAKIIAIEHKNLLLAEDLGIVWTYKQGREFYYWKMMGDRHEIIKEMTFAMQNQKWKLTDRHKGLKWLIHKLNKSRAKNDKLNTEYLYR